MPLSAFAGRRPADVLRWAADTTDDPVERDAVTSMAGQLEAAVGRILVTRRV
jgi:hypothetical protein